MFSKENRRFLTLIIAMVVIVLGTILAIVSMVNKEHAKDSVLVTGFAGILLAQLVSMLRAEQERAVNSTERAEVKKVTVIAADAAGVAADAAGAAARKAEKSVNEVKEVVREAVTKVHDEPAPGHEAMPRTPEELREFLKVYAHEIASEVCDEIAAKSARFAAEAVRDFFEKSPDVNVKNGTTPHVPK
jgi:DNA-directed RNA polymerase subunit F